LSHLSGDFDLTRSHEGGKRCILISKMSTYDRIYAVVRQIPPGKVATYGQVAELAELPRRARLVGYALYRVDALDADIPWHRVINAKGEISHSPLRRGSDYFQRSLLEAEGLEFNAAGKINLRKYLWTGI
jgi:methylated-DNA-protein-cysteine methyltransferase related protein